MNRCLEERTLGSVYEGEGRDAHRAHLQSCAACSARYRRLVDDVNTITRALREVPHPRAVPHRLHLRRVSWVPVALALAVVLVWGGMWAWKPAPRPVFLAETHDEDVALFMGEVSTALFSPVDATAATGLMIAESDAVLEGE